MERRGGHGGNPTFILFMSSSGGGGHVVVLLIRREAATLFKHAASRRDDALALIKPQAFISAACSRGSLLSDAAGYARQTQLANARRLIPPQLA